MQQSDWKTLSYLGLILGVICGIGGIIAHEYVVYSELLGFDLSQYGYPT